MAYSVEKINPLDLQPRKAVGFSLPFSSNSVFTQNYQTKDAIRNNVINYILTARGERYLNPLFGTNIRNQLFEQITEETREVLRSEIQSGIAQTFPRVVVATVEVVEPTGIQGLQVYIRYSIRDTSVTDEVVVNIER
jgi:phage baseplate assembly protein W